MFILELVWQLSRRKLREIMCHHQFGLIRHEIGFCFPPTFTRRERAVLGRAPFHALRSPRSSSAPIRSAAAPRADAGGGCGMVVTGGARGLR